MRDTKGGTLGTLQDLTIQSCIYFLCLSIESGSNLERYALDHGRRPVRERQADQRRGSSLRTVCTPTLPCADPHGCRLSALQQHR